VNVRLGAMLLLTAAQALPADGGTAPGKCRITVRAIEATSGNDSAAPDPKLAPIAMNLREFAKDFRFKTFRLLSEETSDLEWKKQAEMELPGSRSVQVAPQQIGEDGRIKVRLQLLGKHPDHTRRLHTEYSIQRGGTIFIGGMRLGSEHADEGMLLIAVTAQSID
jgi:hypothetical protein